MKLIFINPFRDNLISGSPYFRFNLLSTSFLINLNDNSKQDLLFSVQGKLIL